MHDSNYKHLLAALLTVALHVLVYLLASPALDWVGRAPGKPKAEDSIIFVSVAPAPPATPRPEPEPALARVPATPEPPRPLPAPPPPHAPATQAAPPAPTAEDWALAASYTLKNSKAYRHSFGQQVRSMMGTAIEGPDQGMVRLRVEIAPDGRLARLETLWSTSAVAEQLARRAIETMPPLPPTPTGQPLVFEKTISFSAFATDDPPFYKDDCQPDPPAFRNPFAWDGRAAPQRAAPSKAEPTDPQALAECLKQLPRDSIEAEAAHDRRQLEQWGSARLGR